MTPKLTRLGLLLIAVSSLMVSLPAAACSCAPRDFVHLVREVDVILVADIVKADDQVATIEVVDAFKGHPVGTTIRRSPGQCGSPLSLRERMRYVIGADVISGEMQLVPCMEMWMPVFEGYAWGSIATRRGPTDLILPDHRFARLSQAVPLNELEQALASDDLGSIEPVAAGELMKNLSRGVKDPEVQIAKVSLERDCLFPDDSVEATLLVTDRGVVVGSALNHPLPGCVRNAVSRSLADATAAGPPTRNGRAQTALVEVDVAVEPAPPPVACSSGTLPERRLVLVLVESQEMRVVSRNLDSADHPIEAFVRRADLATAPVMSVHVEDDPCNPDFSDGIRRPPGRTLRTYSSVEGFCISYRDDPVCQSYEPDMWADEEIPAGDVKIDRIVVSADPITIPGYLLDGGNTVLIILSLGSPVEPVRERLLFPPTNPWLPESVAEDFPLFYQRYLSAACRSPRLVSMEYGGQYLSCRYCFHSNLVGFHDLEQLGIELGPEKLARLTMTRLRVLSSPESRQDDLLLHDPSGGRGNHLNWLARVDAVPEGCPKAEAYLEGAEERRRAENELMERLLSADAAFIDERASYNLKLD